MDQNLDWIMGLVNNPTREGVLQLASLYLDLFENQEALSKAYEEHIDEDLADTEDTLALIEKSRKAMQQGKTEHKQAVSALDTLRKRLGIKEGSVNEVAKEIESLFAAGSKIDKQIAQLVDGLLEMQAKKGKVDILTKLVSIQKIKLCARGESVQLPPANRSGRSSR